MSAYLGTHYRFHLLSLGIVLGGLAAPAWALPQGGTASGVHTSMNIARIERSVQTVVENTSNPPLTGNATP
jgi:hypothetical protein